MDACVGWTPGDEAGPLSSRARAGARSAGVPGISWPRSCACNGHGLAARATALKAFGSDRHAHYDHQDHRTSCAVADRSVRGDSTRACPRLFGRLEPGARVSMTSTAEPTGTVDTALAHTRLLLRNNPGLAAEQAGEILKVAPNHPLAMLLLGTALRLGGDAAGALRVLGPLAATQPN